MSEVATVAVGWGVTAVAVASYALWVLLRGRTIGQKLDIGGSSSMLSDKDSTTDQ
jgi:hypothetical protein|tara:strand:+ start:596 stop:760 length:165 start_codon:yes stop_codon:yes gene_type:complete